MGKLKPIGSEKLEGIDKISRILELSNYKLNIPKSINEDKSVEYKKTLTDGNTYHIVKEKSGYVIKKGLHESVTEYLEPIKNRKYYPSYSQALKRLNLITKEVNHNEGFEKNISLFESDEDDTKYFLNLGGEKNEQTTPQAAAQPAPAPVQPTTPPAPETPEPAGEEMPEPEMEMPEPEMETSEPEDEEPEDDEEQVTFKTIQKLTGKLGQKIRAFLSDEENEMSSKDIKYVINSVLSALKLDSLDEEDKEEIMSKFEGGEEQPDMDDMEEPEMEMSEPEEPSAEPMREPEPEVGEEYHHGSMRERQYKKRMDSMFEDMFTESKVDKVLSKYFQPEKKVTNKSDKNIRIVESLCESYDQESSSKKLLKKYPQAKLIGKNKNNNLVFEINEKRISVTPRGSFL
jgi:hypothetical protein